MVISTFLNWFPKFSLLGRSLGARPFLCLLLRTGVFLGLSSVFAGRGPLSTTVSLAVEFDSAVSALLSALSGTVGPDDIVSVAVSGLLSLVGFLVAVVSVTVSSAADAASTASTLLSVMSVLDSGDDAPDVSSGSPLSVAVPTAVKPVAVSSAARAVSSSFSMAVGLFDWEPTGLLAAGAASFVAPLRVLMPTVLGSRMDRMNRMNSLVGGVSCWSLSLVSEFVSLELVPFAPIDSPRPVIGVRIFGRVGSGSMGSRDPSSGSRVFPSGPVAILELATNIVLVVILFAEHSGESLTG